MWTKYYCYLEHDLIEGKPVIPQRHINPVSNIGEPCLEIASLFLAGDDSSYPLNLH